MMKKKQTPKDPKQKKPKRETLEERVHRHLKDINSEITDDDIKNVRTELEIRSDTNPTTESEEQENNEKKSQESKRNEQITLWNTLSNGYESNPET